MCLNKKFGYQAAQMERLSERMTERQKTGRQLLCWILLFTELPPLQVSNKWEVLCLCCVPLLCIFSRGQLSHSEFFRCSIEYHHGYFNFFKSSFIDLVCVCFYLKMQVYLKTNVNRFVQICPKYICLLLFCQE